MQVWGLKLFFYPTAKGKQKKKKKKKKKYDDSEGSPNRDGVSVFLGVSIYAFSDRYEKLFLFTYSLYKLVLNSAVLSILFLCEMKPNSMFLASGGASSGAPSSAGGGGFS